MTFLINLMFSRLGKFDGPMFEGAYIRGRGGAYIRVVNWVAYLRGVYSGGIIYGGRINRY